MRDGDAYWLDRAMDLDHVIRVNTDGTVDSHPSRAHPLTPYAPESVIFTRHDGQIMGEHERAWTESIERQGWSVETGWSGQDRYAGPIMHPSEFIGGGLADHIVASPGLWVAVTVECVRGDPEDAGEDFNPEAHTCDDCADMPDPEIENEDPAGWAILYMDDSPETDSYVVSLAHHAVTGTGLAGLRRMDLAGARKLAATARMFRSTVRIVRVTDLAIMPDEDPS
jgi:hypothetical protein